MNNYPLPSLPYDYDALEPYIDEDTLRYHHDKHHKSYTEKFNSALEKHPKLYDIPLPKLFESLDQVPDDVRSDIRNYGGGYLNHNLLWDSLEPDGGGTPGGNLLSAIDRDLGGFMELKKYLSEISTQHFGSGYGWLVKNHDNNLEIYSLPNQDSPYSIGDTPLLLFDIWEHAYYLKYKNDRQRYIENLWEIINWRTVENRFAN